MQGIWFGSSTAMNDLGDTMMSKLNISQQWDAIQEKHFSLPTFMTIFKYLKTVIMPCFPKSSFLKAKHGLKLSL